jgi:hypothetical protein
MRRQRQLWRELNRRGFSPSSTEDPMTDSVRRAALLLLLFAPAATAQTSDPPRLTVGASGGVTNPLHGDFQFIAPSWDVAVRGQVAGHLAIEGFMSRWRHSTQSAQIDVPLSGPGPIGRVGRIEIENGDQVSMVGFSFEPTFSTGRVTLAAGGGPAMMIFRSDYVQRLSGCDAAVAASCGTYETHRTNGTFAVQFGGAVDVRLAPRLTTFGQVRVGVPIEDPGSGQVAATVGVRLVHR